MQTEASSKIVAAEALVPNPNALNVRVGSYVTAKYSGRRIFVAKQEAGRVWEPMEPGHPAIARNGGCLPDDHLRYVGTEYREFEPLYITAAKLAELLTPKPAHVKGSAAEVEGLEGGR